LIDEPLEKYVHVCFQSFGSDWRLVRSNITSYTRDNRPAEVYDLPTQTIVNTDVKSNIGNQISFLATRQKPVTTQRTRSISSNTKSADRVTEGKYRRSAIDLAIECPILINAGCCSVGPVIEVGLKEDDPHFTLIKPWTPEVDEDNAIARVC
jgi:hypothetical protein